MLCLSVLVCVCVCVARDTPTTPGRVDDDHQYHHHHHHCDQGFVLLQRIFSRLLANRKLSAIGSQHVSSSSFVYVRWVSQPRSTHTHTQHSLVKLWLQIEVAR
uniref:Putative secreted protein n=1 Tax=Anopheles darlingi TaxID=43151 RepID=A0A2M4DIT8_ANODA